MEISGAQAIRECLIREGVTSVFGYPGGAILPFYDAISNEKELKHYLVRIEQGAIHEAQGFARATGQVGVCVVTSGPGATNIVTGLCDAHMDSIPVVAITGQVGLQMIGRDSFQEADVTGITMPVTKHNYLIKHAEEIPHVIKEAFYIAATGRPGPVLIDITKSAQIEKIKFRYPESVDLPSYKPNFKGHPKQIALAAKLIAESERPLMYVGGGAISSGAAKEVVELAEKINSWVTVTVMGKGAFPDEHPRALGMLGMHGAVYTNYAVQDCDLLIAIGSRFDDRVTGKLEMFAPKARIIHIDIDPAEIGKNVKIDCPIVGDVKSVLKDLIKEVDAKPAHKAWIEKVSEWKKKYPLSYKDEGMLPSVYLIDKLSQWLDGDAIVTVDVGQHQMWAAQWMKFKHPRTFLSSSGLGSMGFGLPAAIGAQVGQPNKTVVAVVGDGGFQMTIQELTTAVTYKLPIKVVIVNNGYLGMVRQWQELIYQKRYSSVDLGSNPDLAKLSEAYGATAFVVKKKEEWQGVWKKAMAIKDGPVVIDARVNREENVLPFVPAGQPLNEMIVD